jgi:hypothetical protein
MKALCLLVMQYVMNEETSAVWNEIYSICFVYKKEKFHQKPITDESFQNKCQSSWAEYFILWHDNVVSDI